MKKIIAIIILFFSAQVLACPDLLGTWQSSKKLSMEYNIANTEMESHTLRFLNDILGVVKITYTKDRVHVHAAPTKTIEIKSQRHEFVYEERTFNYKINSCTDETIFVSDDNPYGPSENDPINFVTPNVYWVLLMPGSDKREYFVRLQ